MKKILTGLFFCTCCITLLAQVPGYCGKRFEIQYEATGFPALNPKSYGSSFGLPDAVGLNLKQQVAFSYVVSRNQTLGLQGGLERHQFRRDADQYFTLSEPFYRNFDLRTFSVGPCWRIYQYRFSSEEDYSGRSQDYIDYKDQAKGAAGYPDYPGGRESAHPKTREGGFLAPLGSYVEWKLLGLFSTMDQQILSDNGPINTLLIQQAPYKRADLALCLGFGRQYVIANVITLHAGIQLATLLTGIPDALRQSQNHLTDYSATQRYYLHKKMTDVYALNLNLGIGFLAF